MFDYAKYLRLPMFPHIWCEGCGDGIILKALLRAIDRLKLNKDEITMVSGIGCSSRLPGYVDFNTLHTTHGRAIAFATGVKLAKPEMTVIVVTGDGDGLAIGGNHFIHAARRNIDITVVLFNNKIYGMTGGQVAPTTPEGKFASTTPYGNIEPPFDSCKLAAACGASYVARGTTYHSTALDRMMTEAIQNKGFSFVEVWTDCPVIYGRRNRVGTAVDMLRFQKDNSVSVKIAASMTPEQLKGKIITGVFHKEQRPEYTEEYQKKIIEKAMALKR